MKLWIKCQPEIVLENEKRQGFHIISILSEQWYNFYLLNSAYFNWQLAYIIYCYSMVTHLRIKPPHFYKTFKNRRYQYDLTIVID